MTEPRDVIARWIAPNAGWDGIDDFIAQDDLDSEAAKQTFRQYEYYRQSTLERADEIIALLDTAGYEVVKKAGPARRLEFPFTDADLSEDEMTD